MDIVVYNDNFLCHNDTLFIIRYSILANFREWILENNWDNFRMGLQLLGASQVTGYLANWIIVTLYVCFPSRLLQTVIVQYNRKYYIS